MDIGEPKRVIQVEPEPLTAPAEPPPGPIHEPVPLPVPEPEQVPVREQAIGHEPASPPEA